MTWRIKQAQALERQAAGQRRLANQCLANAEMLERHAADMRERDEELKKRAEASAVSSAQQRDAS